MKMRIPIKAIIAGILTFTVIVSVFTAYFLKENLFGVDINTLRKLSVIDEIIRNDYYYAYDDAVISDAVAEGYVKGLGDSHSAYYSSDKSLVQINKQKGKSYGIGISAVNCNTDDIYVWRVYKGSVAEMSGIKPQDIIVKINGKHLKKIGFANAVEMISGAKKQKLKLSVLRNKKETEISVTTCENEVQSVFYRYIDKKTGVIEITSFNDKTYLQFLAAIKEFEEEKIKNVILDLRHNGGGTVSSAAKILDILLPECPTVKIKLKDGKIKVRNRSDEKHSKLNFKILCDGKTASAAEIFISAMRDYSNTSVYGEKTYGKSVIQRSYDLYDGSRIKITIAEFVDKHGNSFNKKGILPDVDLSDKMPDDYGFYFMTDKNDAVLAQAIKDFQ